MKAEKAMEQQCRHGEKLAPERPGYGMVMLVWALGLRQGGTWEPSELEHGASSVFALLDFDLAFATYLSEVLFLH